MSGFSQTVVNGKYIVKLHFAETFEGVTDAGQRVFTVDVEGHKIKNLDVYAKAGGPQAPAKPEKSNRGRWLARLGLKDSSGN